MGWLPYLVTAVIFMAIGTIYGSLVTDIWWEEKKNAD